MRFVFILITAFFWSSCVSADEYADSFKIPSELTVSERFDFIPLCNNPVILEQWILTLVSDEGALNEESPHGCVRIGRIEYATIHIFIIKPGGAFQIGQRWHQKYEVQVLVQQPMKRESLLIYGFSVYNAQNNL